MDPATYDIVKDDNFQLRFTATLTEYVAQKIENLLSTFQNEWFLDRSLGLPYYDRILIKNADLDDVDNLFQSTITGVTEVEELLEYESDFDTSQRKYTVTFKALLTNGETAEGSVTI